MFDLHSNPPLPAEVRRTVIADLAGFLVAGEAGRLAGWSLEAWQFAEWACYWQGASAWLASQLKTARLDPPEPVAARLSAFASASRQRTHRMLADASALLAAFRQKNIPAIPLKGAILARQVYPDPESRALGDLDFLVRRGDLPAVRSVLAGAGYRYLKRSEKDETYLLGEYRDHPWSSENVRPVEIHHRVLCEFSGHLCDLTEILWKHSRMLPYDEDVACQQAGSPALLAHLSAHALADWVLGQGKLTQIHDLLLVSCGLSSAEWDEFIRLSRPQARFILPALLLLERLSAGCLSPELASLLAACLPPQLQSWCRQVSLASLFELYTDEAIRRDFDLRIARLFRRGPSDDLLAAIRLAFPPRWHSRLDAYPRLATSPAWPLAYIPLNAGHLSRMVRKQQRR